ncbi:hypothetical protein AB0F46_01845 [Streptomyces sp. NPDC026665]|uniref:hypothetical protein n=1 Tax=Streptomyces sp. NPDC026665 TaxID=3154798 RepID=UPI00340D2D65
MSAIEERAAVALGKGTCDRSQRSVGDATRALTLPHLPYGDAVHAALHTAGIVPDTMEAGCRVDGASYGKSRLELFLRLEWLPGHEDLAVAHRATGMALEWSHLVGWTVRFGDDLAVLDADELAAPDLLVAAVLEAATEGFGFAWTPPPGAGRWDFALELDIALVAFDDRGVTR